MSAKTNAIWTIEKIVAQNANALLQKIFPDVVGRHMVNGGFNTELGADFINTNDYKEMGDILNELSNWAPSAQEEKIWPTLQYRCHQNRVFICHQHSAQRIMIADPEVRPVAYKGIYTGTKFNWKIIPYELDYSYKTGHRMWLSENESVHQKMLTMQKYGMGSYPHLLIILREAMLQYKDRIIHYINDMTLINQLYMGVALQINDLIELDIPHLIKEINDFDKESILLRPLYEWLDSREKNVYSHS